MTKFSNKSKKPYFWLIFPIFGIKTFFKQIGLCHAQQHMSLWHHAEFQKKFIRQSQENIQIERWKDGLTDPNSQDLSSHSQGSNKYDT